MKERNITVTLDKAKEWFNSGNATLREVALQAFNKDELICDFFRRIITFRRACEALRVGYIATISTAENIAYYSKASAAMFKLNIIREALNFGQDLSLTKDPECSHIYYPLNPLVTTTSTFYNDEISSGKVEIIGKIKSEGREYNVLGGVGKTGSAGLGSFTPDDGVCSANASFGFLGCANAEIAEHFGKYFGMLITEAKYADMISDFEIIESKYSI